MTPLRPLPPDQCGELATFEIESAVLAACNPLGDPVCRLVGVYLPRAYFTDRQRHFPVLLNLPAYTSSGPAQWGWRNHGENLVARLDRLMATGAMPPAIVVMPDTYTALGGNQFVDSPALGDYPGFLLDELIPELDRRFRTLAQPDSRGVFGKSSGGFGALHLAVTRPGCFAAVASHAGDCAFDRVYIRDFPDCCNELAAHDGDLEAFVRAFWRERRPSGRAFHALMVLCLAASYSPEAGLPLGLRLPFDLHTARLNPEVWARWLAFDPVEYDGARHDTLRRLRGLWIDAGNRDQYFIQFGTRELHRRLQAAGVQHHYEEFDGDHSGMDWRFDHSLPWLLSRLVID
ncbi:MAG: alpha/beta hydrolase-fold protein [Wenzhouxiangellaceae bacterium]